MYDLLRQPELYRLEHKITQEQLAKELGVAFATVNTWFQAEISQTNASFSN
jgi:transcriptional regulator with XRE-family HTH domain